MKEKRKWKVCIILITMIVTSLFGSFQKVSADEYNVTIEYDSSWSAIAGNTGLYGNLAILKVNGQYAFCLEANKAAHSGDNTEINFGDLGISKEQEQELSLIANFGFFSQPTITNYALTQNLIWKYLGYTCGYVNTSYSTMNNQLEWQDAIMGKVKGYTTGVSFHQRKYEVNVGQTIQLEDTNQVLSSMKIISNDGLDTSIKGNALQITGNMHAKDNATITLEKAVANAGINFVVRKGNSQAISVLQTSRTMQSSVSIKVNKYIDVNLEKVDSELGSFNFQGDASMLGAIYGLYDASDNQLIETKIIGESGKIRFEKLWSNQKYYIKEIEAPTGYLLSKETFHIDPLQLLSNGAVNADLQYTIIAKENVKKQAFQIIKVSSDGDSGEIPTLEGAEFTVKLLSETKKVGWEQARTYDTLITDIHGQATSIRLPYGTYLVKETKTPLEVITARDFIVTVQEDSMMPQAYRVLNNAPFEAYLRLIKVDELTGERITFSKATFQIKNENMEVISQKLGDTKIDTFMTDETGKVTTPLMVSAGTYYIDEIKTPEGFLGLEEAIRIVITNQGAVEIDEDNDPIFEIIVKNERPVGKIIVQKTYEEFETNQELYATFELRANEDIINPINGEVLVSKGQTIPNMYTEDSLYHTDDNHQIIIDNLSLGLGSVEYQLIEVDTTSHYQLAEPLVITLSQTDTMTKEYIYQEEIENKLTVVNISKQDAQTKQLVIGATLEVIDVNQVVVKQWVTTDDNYVIKGLHRGQEYQLHESNAPIGYMLAEDITFVVERDEYIVMYDIPIAPRIVPVATNDDTQGIFLGMGLLLSVLGILQTKRKFY